MRRIGWNKVLSIRIAGTALVGGLIVGALLGAIWQPLSIVAIPVALLGWYALVMDSSTVAYCSHCGKRVKIGSTVCHHCGRDVVVAN